MKIGIDMGHSLSGAGTGASGLMSEVQKNREVGNLLIQMLRNKGHEVVNCTVDYANSVNEQLAGIVKKANAQTLDYFVSIHLNSFTSPEAKGTETYIYKGSYPGKEATRAFAKRVNDEVVKSCNFYNRGVKEGDYYVCRNTNCKAILVELCFCTSPVDRNIWNADKIARGLYKGITGEDYIETVKGWKVGDHCKIHGNVISYTTGDTVSPYDYFYRIKKIEGDEVILEDLYIPVKRVKLQEIWR